MVERKKKVKVELEFFTLEKNQGENSNLQISRVVIMGVVGVEVTAFLRLPWGPHHRKCTEPHGERLDFGKNFPAGKDLGSRQGREYMVVESPPLGNLSAGHSHLGPGEGRGSL